MASDVKTVTDAEKYFLLHSPPRMAGNYSLDRMSEMMHRLNNPQNNLRIIHIAGTSGKTSTAYFIRAMLQQAGKKTGLTVSPHIRAITERVQINGTDLPEETFIGYVNDFKATVDTWHDLSPTYFELLIAFAYWVFDKEAVDYAVIETGLGGLLDATNIVNRQDKLCVITPIGYDHTEILGETLPEIAKQKAGIIQQNNVVLLSDANRGLLEEFQSEASAKNASLRMQKMYDSPEEMPAFQVANWQLARTVYDELQSRDASLKNLDENELTKLAKMTPPGRFELYTINNKKIVLDGAHNPQKLEAFFGSLPEAMRQNPTILFGLRNAPDAKVEACIALVKKLKCRIICTEFQVGQDIKQRHSVAAKELSKLCKQYGVYHTVEPDYKKALALLLDSPGDTKIVTGSLYLVALLREDIIAASTL